MGIPSARHRTRRGRLVPPVALALAFAACSTFGFWASRRSCTVCLQNTNLSLRARGFDAPRLCSSLEEDPQVVACQVSVESDPLLCTQKRRFLEVQVRDRGIFGQGLLGAVLCQELRSRPIEEVLADH